MIKRKAATLHVLSLESVVSESATLSIFCPTSKSALMSTIQWAMTSSSILLLARHRTVVNISSINLPGGRSAGFSSFGRLERASPTEVFHSVQHLSNALLSLAAMRGVSTNSLIEARSFRVSSSLYGVAWNWLKER